MVETLNLTKMNEELAEWEIEAVDEEALYDVLLNGCSGWANKDPEESIQEYCWVFDKGEDFLVDAGEKGTFKVIVTTSDNVRVEKL